MQASHVLTSEMLPTIGNPGGPGIAACAMLLSMIR